MRVMFRVLHSLEKKGRPFSDYEWALDLQEITHKITLERHVEMTGLVVLLRRQSVLILHRNYQLLLSTVS